MAIEAQNGETIVRVSSIYTTAIRYVNVRSMSIARFRYFTWNLPENDISVVSERYQDERSEHVLESARLSGSAYLIQTMERNRRNAMNRRALTNGELF